MPNAARGTWIATSAWRILASLQTQHAASCKDVRGKAKEGPEKNAPALATVALAGQRELVVVVVGPLMEPQLSFRAISLWTPISMCANTAGSMSSEHVP